MCLLTTSTIHNLKKVFLNTPDLLDQVYQLNPDGLGVMYSDGRKLHVLKVLPRNAAEARRFIESLPDDSEHMIACHWRMKTHGLIDMANCHPYRVSNDTYLAHNGILHTGNDNDVEKSDTWHFIHDYLRTLPTDALHDPGLARMLGEFIDNNRFAIMSADGRLTVVNRDQGVETHGIWFSNTYAWYPDTLMPAYRQRYAVRPYKEYYDGSAWGLLDHDDTEDAPDVAMLRASVADEVHEAMGSYDEYALADAFHTHGSTAVNVVLCHYELKPYDHGIELPETHQAATDAWLRGDDAWLSKQCLHSAQVLAESLVYYCDWDFSDSNTPKQA